MLLSGDDLTRISADFEDDSFQVGRTELGRRQIVSVLNWGDAPQTISFPLPRRSWITDFWTGAGLGTHAGAFEVKEMPARSGRLLICD